MSVGTRLLAKCELWGYECEPNPRVAHLSPLSSSARNEPSPSTRQLCIHIVIKRSLYVALSRRALINGSNIKISYNVRFRARNVWYIENFTDYIYRWNRATSFFKLRAAFRPELRVVRKSLLKNCLFCTNLFRNCRRKLWLLIFCQFFMVYRKNGGKTQTENCDQTSVLFSTNR